ncbi:MAG: aminotransferase class V-fold PLP-dependent enzyme [Bacteroidota bacterium]|jgi:isopenicillin-N epimerase
MHNPDNFKDLFLIDSEITFLNFGSFGACPKSVFEEYQNWQLVLEREPVQFIAFDGLPRVRNALKVLADFIHCDPMDLVFTPNPTFAFNIVAANLDLKPGDEILTTDLEYGAMDRTWEFYCSKKGAKYIKQPIELPIRSEEHFLDSFWKGVTEKTRAVFISHITSATALKLPVESLCKEAKRRGLITIVDGAHVPAHSPLNIKVLDPDFYTGACHKWMMAPKGCSFLYAKKNFQDSLEPLIVSWGYKSDNPTDSKFFDHHQFNGTRDFSAYLTLPATIDFMNENNWSEVANSCRNLVRENAMRFCELTGGIPLAPLDDSFHGQMFAIPIRASDPMALQRKLFLNDRIEVPVTKQGSRTFVRYSIQAFNSQAELDLLYNALYRELKSGELASRL